MKNVKKQVKKNIQPDFIMNCTDLQTQADVYNELVHAKVRAGKPITEEELDIAKDYAAADAEENILIITECNLIEKKKPWYKRFWNWLRRK